ncbi:T9SS C-terminal target domain-containing protein [Croceitalea sp. MTPC5]|uniref:T9SS type B sorting domain-containing protein n=1 Tax=Croceitalea sp. MTPC5 TaxID=3056565 RepID=UPI002B3F0ACE|nr:T9SS C-terminal target domain-containing protein [Croceitalea sp. MTPC5]
MNLRLLTFFLATFWYCSVHAQLEASIWYFGENAGLDFRSGTPIPLLDGQIATREGCSVISDATGNLLFYSDGLTVWNRNHQVMANGTGLAGHPSSTNAGIIVPSPGMANIYYIFTSGAFDNFNLGVHYSVIDLSLDGGFGEVVTKNIPLLIPATEKLTAVKHANGTDIWVVTHDLSGSFYAYRVTATGVITTPVLSTVGVDLSTFADIDGRVSGQLKFSPDGTKAVVVHSRVSAELLDFDASTGQFSNARHLVDDIGEFGDVLYGAEFSPSGRFVYVSYFATAIYQFDTQLANPIPLELYASTPFGPQQYAAMQLAIDGKIYIADFFQNSLSIIQNPNLLGAASNLQFNVIDLGGRFSNVGLPPFIQSFFFVGDIQAQNLCFGDSTAFSINTSEAITSINWDFGDGTTSTLENPTHIYTAPGTYTVSVVVSTASETKTETSQVTIFEIPTANTPGDILGCTSYGSYNLDLTSFDPTVLGTQDPDTFTVSYFLTQADADANSNPIGPVHSFDYGTTTVFVRVSNTNNSLCYDTTQFDVVARQAPLVDVVTDWSVCDDDLDGRFIFDLTLKDAEIFNGQDETLFDILYFATQADADAGTDPLPIPYTNTLPLEEVFFRFQNSTYTSCFRTGSFNIEVLEGVTANTPTDLSVCDDDNDGQASFDLGATLPEIIGAQNAGDLVISYHGSQADADANTDPLPTEYSSTAYQTTIYVRVANASDTSCFDTTSFDLTVFDTPMAQTVADWQVCGDNNDGTYGFDLNEKANEILAMASGANVFFYESQVDAEMAQDPIAGTFQNTGNPQTLYFRLENTLNPHCFDVGSFQLEVFDTPTAFPPSAIVICDVDGTGSYGFDLSQKDTEVLNGQDPDTYQVSYHGSELDALNNENAVSKTDYRNTGLNETIFVRVQHSQFDICYDVSSFDLIINPLPQLDLEETYVICPDSPDLVIDGGIFETYEWRNADNEIVGSQRELAVSELGVYSLTVTRTTNEVVCENTASFEVLSSGAPESFTVDVSGFSDSITLIVDALGIGDFEYSIDGTDFQSSNSFEVLPGTYTVFVRDPLECRVLEQEVMAIGFQKFFTPNGDDRNEHWNIIGAGNMPNALVAIYDRYGKLLRQLSPSDTGWDGTFQGSPMPSADYWFRFDTGNGQQMTGHFTLKR